MSGSLYAPPATVAANSANEWVPRVRLSSGSAVFDSTASMTGCSLSSPHPLLPLNAINTDTVVQR